MSVMLVCATDLEVRMCDELTLRDAELAERRATVAGRITRRQLGVAAAGVSLAAVLPKARATESLTQADVRVTTPDGEADCYFAHPATGKHPGVDRLAGHPRSATPAFRDMGDRLAASGYAVLTVNPYYRQAQAPVVEEGCELSGPGHPREGDAAGEIAEPRNERHRREGFRCVPGRPRRGGHLQTDRHHGLLHGRTHHDANRRRRT